MKQLRLLLAYVWLMVRVAGKRTPGRRPSHSVRSATCFVCLLSVVGSGATSSPEDAARNAPSEVVASLGLAISTPSTNSRSSRLSLNDHAAFAYDAPGRVTTSRNFVATKPGGGAATKPAGVPDDFVAVVANNGKGTVWRAPGTTTNAGTVRVMEPTAQYPNGYVRFYNNSGPGQPIGLDGKTGPNSHTHIPINPDGTYPLPKGWGA